MIDKKYLLLLGGGEGKRFSSSQEKICVSIQQFPIFAFSMHNFFSTIADWSEIFVVCAAQSTQQIVSFLQDNYAQVTQKVQFSPPGRTRSHSVWNAIKDVKSANKDQIWIHDLARPCISVEDIRSLAQIASTEANLPLIPGKVVTDSLKKIHPISGSERTTATIHSSMCREEFVRVSTPQIFPFAKLQAAYAAGMEHLENFTDDEQLYSQYFSQETSTLFFCNRPNPKLTFEADLTTVTGFLNDHPIRCKDSFRC